MKMDGYVKLHRRLIDSRVFQNEGLLKVWVWCLLKASYTKRWVPVVVGRAVVEVELQPGQFVFGRASAAQALRMTPSGIWKRMQKLKNLQNCDIESNSHYSIITIRNWDTYQSDENKSDSERNCRVTAEEQPSNTNKKGKKGKKGKKEDIKDSPEPALPTSGPALPPVIEIPLIAKDGHYPVTQLQIDDWQTDFPGIDVVQALRNIRQWNQANPTKRKTQSGILRHIVSWLTREQDRNGGRSGPAPNQRAPDPRTYAQCQDLERRQMTRMLKDLENADRDPEPNIGPAHQVEYCPVRAKTGG
jgi:hypothetical protein